VVQPILKEGCYNCHGPKKQKGKLRFDEKEAIIKGGKNGKTVVAGKPEDSEMIKRLLLPLDHEDHMPPKNKAQLTKQQISVLQWWIGTGADFNKKVSEVKQPENVKPILLALESGVSIPESELTEVPEQPVEAADTTVTEKLFRDGVMIMPVARNSNYLSANFVTAASSADALISSLIPLKKQLLSLKLDHANITDSSLTRIAQLNNLRRLQISNTAITDAGIVKLSGLKELQSLNVVGTTVSAKGLSALKDLKRLKYLYLYKTSINTTEREELKKMFPETMLDFGNYSLPMLITDTTEVNINQ
jgi:Leucine-rich repeat (LRR) protein